MVLRIEKGLYHIWDCLKLRLDSDLDFRVNQSYVLIGDNGSGKTSFVKQLLLQKCKSVPDRNFHLFYIDQDFLLQYHAIQAHSAANKRFNGKIKSYDDAIRYMYDYYKKCLSDNEFLFLVFDEVEMYADLEPFLQDRDKYSSIIVLVTHSDIILRKIADANIIGFKKSLNGETMLRLRENES